MTLANKPGFLFALFYRNNRNKFHEMGEKRAIDLRLYSKQSILNKNRVRITANHNRGD